MTDVFDRLPANCAHMDCGYHAIAKVKTKTGYASLCIKHYQKHYQDRAEEKCVELELLTAGQCREWLKQNGLKVKTFTGEVQ